MDIPRVDGSCSFVLAGELAGVEDLFGQDPLITLYLPVVTRRVGLGLLMSSRFADDTGEVAGSVTGAVGSEAFRVTSCDAS